MELVSITQQYYLHEAWLPISLQHLYLIKALCNQQWEHQKGRKQ